MEVLDDLRFGWKVKRAGFSQVIAVGPGLGEQIGVGRTLVKAEIPELEITRYAIELRSLSHGTGSFTRSYLRHEPLPSHLAAKVAADSKPG